MTDSKEAIVAENDLKDLRDLARSMAFGRTFEMLTRVADRLSRLEGEGQPVAEVARNANRYEFLRAQFLAHWATYEGEVVSLAAATCALDPITQVFGVLTAEGHKPKGIRYPKLDIDAMADHAMNKVHRLMTQEQIESFTQRGYKIQSGPDGITARWPIYGRDYEPEPLYASAQAHSVPMDAYLRGDFDASAQAGEAGSPLRSEIRRNEDGTLDEVVGFGSFHLEQMDTGHWWLQLGPHMVNLRARKITAHVGENECPDADATYAMCYPTPAAPPAVSSEELAALERVEANGDYPLADFMQDTRTLCALVRRLAQPK